MNTSRLFSEVGNIYESSIINEGKSTFPAGTFKNATDKKVKPAEAKGTKAFVQKSSGPETKGAETLIKPSNNKPSKIKKDDETSVFSGEKFSIENPEFTQNPKTNKKGKKAKKIAEGKINNFMTKSIFDKLYEAVINENDLPEIPGDTEAHDAEALDLPTGDEEGEVTITLDRETAKKLHDVLMSVLESESDDSEEEGSDASAEDAEEDAEKEEDEEDSEELAYEETELEELSDEHGKKLQAKGSQKVASTVTSNVDGSEGDGAVKVQQQPAPKKEKLKGPDSVSGKANVVAGRASNVGKVAFAK
jgi:hypothetical protein